MTVSLDEDEYKFTIGKLAQYVSEINGSPCTTAMIYNYEKQGLIIASERTQGKTRLFTKKDIGRVLQIKRWQEDGFSLSEIKLRLKNSDPSVFAPPQGFEIPVARRALILEAATQVFPQKGYLKTTIVDIIRQAGVSSPTFYQYFDSKEELFLALIERISITDLLTRLTSLYEQRANAQIDLVRDVLIKTGEAFLETHRKNDALVHLYLSECRRFPSVGMYYCKNLIAPTENLLQSYLSTQIQSGLIPDIDLQIHVHSFFGMLLNFWLAEELMSGKEVLAFPENDRIGLVVNLFLYGILGSGKEVGKKIAKK